MFEKALEPGQLTDQEMSVFEVAREAGREDDYKTYYRYYCRFTHAGLRAIDQSHNDLDYMDDPGIALAILVTLTGLQAMGVSVDNLMEIGRRLRELLASRDLISSA